MLRTRADLVPHPGNPRPAPELRIAASVERTEHTLELRYELAGDLAAVAWPAATTQERSEGLWRHTCFEAFCALPGAGAYYELNFSPSTCWAGFRFGGYRERLADPEFAAAPTIETREAGALRVVDIRVDIGKLPRLKPKAPLEVGLAAVIEGRDARIHHFALGHPAERADFHDRRGFLVTLPGYGATTP